MGKFGGRYTLCMAIYAVLFDFVTPCSQAFCRLSAGLPRARFGFFAENTSSPFGAIVPNVCLLSTFSGKERERQRVGNWLHVAAGKKKNL